MQRKEVRTATLLVFAGTLSLSAMLLFSVQPMIGKMLLPRVGGSSAVWNVAMAFFQLCLLSGYLLAHLLNRYPVRRHALLYIASLIAACFCLPIALPDGWQIDTAQPVIPALIKVLLTSIAIPFTALSLSASTLQRMFVHTRHPKSDDPYFLYAASNLGSLCGLLAYPFLIEPMLDLKQQAQLWQWLMYACLALAGICLWFQYTAPALLSESKTTPSVAVSRKQQTLWLILAFIPSSLMLGTTTYITNDIAAAPLFWVLPLALYLISYIIAFSKRGQSIRNWSYVLLPWFGAASITTVLFPITMTMLAVLLSLAAFFLTAVVCHTELARRRPAADQLTVFYLCLAAGGAMGGSFNALLAPLVFNRIYEYGLVLITALALHIRDPRCFDKPAKLMIPVLALITLTAINLLVAFGDGPNLDDMRNVILIPLAATLFAIAYCHRLAVYAAVAALTLLLFFGNFLHSGSFSNEYRQHNVFTGRSFFGAMTVSEFNNFETGFRYRILQHGTTSHGLQLLMPGRTKETTTYYAANGPIGRIWTILHPKSVAVIGLGAGTLNCLKQPDQRVRFIEIDPLVIRIAHTYFSFLSECGEPAITLGDGRLSLARDTEKYDVIVVDAFASDSVPIHLMTREAIASYMEHLTPEGVVVFHVSNRFFNLEPVLAAGASSLGLAAAFGASLDQTMGTNEVAFSTQVVAISRNFSTFNRPGFDPPMWRVAQNTSGIKPWTDDYSNILAAIK